MDKIIGELPPGRYDAHIHIYPGRPDPTGFAAKLAEAGLRGAVILSENPDPLDGSAPPDPAAAMDRAVEWASASETVYPFYWINPVAPGAADLVDLAVEKGMFGFKVLPSRFFPGDERAMPVYERIARSGRPLLFHSGILWDGRPSSKFTRPGNFEELLDVEGLRFCIAHISWPWCDECIAVYGKFLNALTRSAKPRAEMHIDITPGTPKIYRREALTKLFTVGYDVSDRVQFGSDCRANDYTVPWTRDWMETDDAIYAGLGGEAVDPDSVYRRALSTFLFGGGSAKRCPTPDGTEGGQ